MIPTTSLKILCILDEFSYECFKYECYLVPLDVNSWEQQLIQEKPHFVFIESAFSLYQNQWFSRKNGLYSLLSTCHKMHIPTVFWNKEDPIFFHKFISIASYFDYVFTTDSNCINNYQYILKHDRIFLLPFAAQPKLHNPINRRTNILGKVAFAGTWYKNYPQRIQAMETILDPSLKYNLHIYDRMYNNTLINYFGFPKKYIPYIKKSVPYSQISSIYKNYDVFLNANIVQNSPSMFSRRVFELLGCGTPVVSSYAWGIKKFFPHIVKLCKQKKDTEKYLSLLLNSKLLRDQLSLLGQRQIFNLHTYAHRLKYICDHIGVPFLENDTRKGVSIIVILENIESIYSTIENFTRQTYKNKELIIILNEGHKIPHTLLSSLVLSPYIKLLQTNRTWTLKKCIDYALQHSSFDSISFFHPTSYYGPHYLEDLMHGFSYTEVPVIGKNNYYSFIPETQSFTSTSTSSSHEHQFVDTLCPFSFIVKKDFLKAVPLQDTKYPLLTFFKDLNRYKIPMYSGDSFNFIYSEKLIEFSQNSKFHTIII